MKSRNRIGGYGYHGSREMDRTGGARFTCETDKRLSTSDWEEIKGSNIHAVMMRNRLVLRTQAGHLDPTDILGVLEMKVTPMARDLWHIDAITGAGETIYIYMLNRSDAAAVRLMLHDWTMSRDELDQGREFHAKQAREYGY
ncbi:MAG: hypothetical protein EOP83_03970 [Verrucomicrobiaceae bacterium]|nr:MAG: hypothetical protein EOP83_03970 [Verrucomicrobiaceae bacterium]